MKKVMVEYRLKLYFIEKALCQLYIALLTLSPSRN